MCRLTKSLVILSVLVIPLFAEEITVENATQLEQVLQSALPGDIINLESGIYNGSFVVTANGTRSNPIILHTGAQNIKITGQDSLNSVGLTIVGNYWRIKYLPISHYDTGVLITGRGVVLESLAVTSVNTGVEVTGRDSVIENCAVEATTVGITLRGNNATVKSCSLRGSELAIVGDENICCGKIESNVANGQIQVLGERFWIKGNVILEVKQDSKTGNHQKIEFKPNIKLVPESNESTSILSSIAGYFRSLV